MGRAWYPYHAAMAGWLSACCWWLTDDQAKWHAEWGGYAVVVETVDEAIQVVTGVM